MTSGVLQHKTQFKLK